MESEKVEEKPPSETTPTIQPSEPAPTEEQKKENSGLTQDINYQKLYLMIYLQK